ncbi:protein CHROMATIN REMODELING 19 [Rhododendron vialii]|uniref:protein CHROMATIN REMODELING 19 n=1 Tax=Rhododendron vialii TaxID=182163 RepID=UPI00265E4A7D|nr:protein CHROMATIN REMODELING 19 [Rhododendron vialii]
MKRPYVEISDDEWENHSSFDPSRVLKKPSNPPPPPPIESFAFRSSSTFQSVSSSSSDDSLLAQVENFDGNLVDDDLEDDDAEGPPPPTFRGRKFVVDEDSDGDFNEVEVVRVEEEEEEEIEEMVEESDVVGKALQNCAKISAELRSELYGSGPAAAAYDRYSEVEASSVRIVTQEDVDTACGAEDSDFQPVLKPYQLVGVNFLLLLYKKRIGGAILADEMGLGKTIQAITYLTLLKHLEGDPGPHLIVCPASVLENWERELKKWCPSFSVLQYHGAGRAAYSKELSSLGKTGFPPPFNVILVCYSLFERRSVQQKDDRKVLKHWNWSCVLMDEAHALKDKSSYRWKNLMSVARKANQRLMLTGTPLQNDLHELWSLLEFMMPDLFDTGDVDLKKLLNSGDTDLISRMKSIMGPFILRRLKADVMEQLVPKIQEVKYVEMVKQQDDAYKEAVEECRARTQTNNGTSTLPQRQISNYFVQFRKIANHPLLVRRMYTDEDVVRFAKKLHPMGVFGFECTLDRVIEELKSYNDYSIHRLLLHHGVSDKKGVLSDEHVMISAKCQELANLLPSLKESGHRVLIFSQWTSMLDILEWTLDVIGVTYRRLDGSTQVTERQTIVDTFNNDTSIFACLLSTRAGGQGLNLIGADTVVIHDMDFNPQIDRQAEDRCHRIGQTKEVTIYRLVTKGTVDENVYEIAKRKLVLDAAVLKSGEEVKTEGGDMPDNKTMGEILSSMLLGSQ